MEERQFSPGQLLVKQGDPSDFVYRINFGRAEVFSEVGDTEVVLGQLKEGDFVGEMGIIDGQPRSASVRAKEAVRVEVLERWEFFKLASNDKSTAFQLISRLSDRVRVTNLKLTEAGTAEADADARDKVDPAAAVTTTMSIDAKAVQARLKTERKVTITPASSEMTAYLPEKGEGITAFPFAIGREPQGLEPPPNLPIHLALPDSVPLRLSRQHFAVLRREEGYAVLDLGSTLGTEVNGVSIGHHFSTDVTELVDGDNIISAGGVDSPFRFLVRLE